MISPDALNCGLPVRIASALFAFRPSLYQHQNEDMATGLDKYTSNIDNDTSNIYNRVEVNHENRNQLRSTRVDDNPLIGPGSSGASSGRKRGSGDRDSCRNERNVVGSSSLPGRRHRSGGDAV